MRINFFFRKTHQDCFSIRNLFYPLINYLDNNLLSSNESTTSYELKRYNNTLSNVFYNIFDAQKYQGDINHITADVYSILFGFNRPTIITIHDCNPLLRYSKLNPRYWVYRILMYELPMFLAKKVTVVSNKTKNELLQLTNCNRNKIEVIPNFVNDKFIFTPYSFNELKPTILQVGTGKNKNLENLALAIKGLNCHLRILGKPDKAQLEHLENCEIDYSCIYFVPTEDVVNEFQKADLIAFVSYYEGFGLPIIEGQATGRPVITSNLSPLDEVAGDGALFVDPNQPGMIRAAIERIFKEKELRKTLIAKGIENVKKYRLKTIARKYYELYHTLLPVPDNASFERKYSK